MRDCKNNFDRAWERCRSGVSGEKPAEIWDTARGPGGQYRDMPRTARIASQTRQPDGFHIRALDGPGDAAGRVPDSAAAGKVPGAPVSRSRIRRMAQVGPLTCGFAVWLTNVNANNR